MFDLGLLNADLVGGLADAMPIIRNVLLVLIALDALILIIAVLFQTGSGQDATAITGATESYYSQNKGSSLDDKLNRLTKICAIVMVGLLLLYFVSLIIYHG